MDVKYFSFQPHGDVGVEELDIVKQHDNLINNNKYSEATSLLDNNRFNKGARASLFNSIQNKIRNLQLYFLNKYVASREEYYSITEPTVEFMNENGYKFWINPFE